MTMKSLNKWKVAAMTTRAAMRMDGSSMGLRKK
jgi:hypothetical protein